MIPFGGWLTAFFGGKGPVPATGVRAIRYHLRTPDRKDISVTGVIGGLVPIQDLNLDTPRKRDPHVSDRIGPDKQPRVPLGLHVPPIELDNEVFVHSLGPQRSSGNPRTDDESLLDGEGRRSNVDGDPSRKISPVKQGDKRLLFGREKTSGKQHQNETGRLNQSHGRNSDKRIRGGIETRFVDQEFVNVWPSVR